MIKLLNMKFKSLQTIALTILIGASFLHAEETEWKLDSEKNWKQNLESSKGAAYEGGGFAPREVKASLLTKLQSFDKKRSAVSLTVSQSPVWQNWSPIENLGPINLNDAPVLLTMGPDNYWMFGRYGSGQPREKKVRNANPFQIMCRLKPSLKALMFHFKPRVFPINTMLPVVSNQAKVAITPGKVAI